MTGDLATTPEVVESVTAKPGEAAPPATAGEKEGEKEGGESQDPDLRATTRSAAACGDATGCRRQWLHRKR